jgi:hypothetical protein
MVFGGCRSVTMTKMPMRPEAMIATELFTGPGHEEHVIGRKSWGGGEGEGDEELLPRHMVLLQFPDALRDRRSRAVDASLQRSCINPY